MKKSKKMTQPLYNTFFMAEKDKTANKIQTSHTAAQSLDTLVLRDQFCKGQSLFQTSCYAQSHYNSPANFYEF